MTYKNVTSSAIEKIGYDSKTGETEIVFKSGGKEKKNLTQEQYNAFVNADSVGLHYVQHIKTAKVKVIEKNFKMK